MITDEEVLERHAPGVKHRASLELQIVNKLLQDIAAAGYTAVIDEYRDDGERPSDLKDALFNLDEAHLELFKGRKSVGCIYLVFGNSGWDLICDYSISLEKFLEGVNKLADELEAKE